MSARTPCFYSEAGQLLTWDWDFTEFSLEELVKLAYDIFIVSGVMEEFAIRPKVWAARARGQWKGRGEEGSSKGREAGTEAAHYSQPTTRQPNTPRSFALGPV